MVKIEASVHNSIPQIENVEKLILKKLYILQSWPMVTINMTEPFSLSRATVQAEILWRKLNESAERIDF